VFCEALSESLCGGNAHSLPPELPTIHRLVEMLPIWLAETHFLASNTLCCSGGTKLFRPCQINEVWNSCIDSNQVAGKSGHLLLTKVLTGMGSEAVAHNVSGRYGTLASWAGVLGIVMRSARQAIPYKKDTAVLEIHVSERCSYL